jgi:hypothetical protein
MLTQLGKFFIAIDDRVKLFFSLQPHDGERRTIVP